MATKEKREDRAQKRLTKTLPFFKEVHTFIKGYKKRSDPESIFVYALDKTISNLVVSLHADKGRGVYRKLGATLEMLEDSKRGKVDLHPAAKALWDETTKLLAQYDKKYKIFPRITASKTPSRRSRTR